MKTNNYSVVIPTYNSSTHLLATLQSIENQTVKPDVVFLVDDCSDDIDAIYSIVESINTQVNIVDKAVKSNAAHSRNIGWHSSTSDYIFFLDSDDQWLPNHAELVLKSFIDYQCDCVYTSFNLVRGNKSIKKGIFDINDYNNPLEFLFSGGDFRSSTIAVRNDLFEKAKFDNASYKHQDWDFLLSIHLSNSQIKFLDVNTVNIYASGEHRMSSKNNIAASEYFIDKWRSYFTRRSTFRFLFNLLKVDLLNNAGEFNDIFGLSKKHCNKFTGEFLFFLTLSLLPYRLSSGLFKVVYKLR